ncbi:MAG: glycoside hydrolase family 16 protein [Candidatus Saccharibacteria bacterium]
MAQRLPVPGQDDGTWGTVLNGYLVQSHNSDGTLKPSAVTAAGAYNKPSSGIPAADMDGAAQADLGLAATAVQSVNTKLPVSGNVTLAAADVGAITQSTADTRYVPLTTPTVPSAVGLLWSDEFTESSMSYATDTGGGTWRTKPHEAGGTLANGYSDFAGSSWNVSAADATTYGIVTIASSIMTIKAMRNPGLPGVSNNWIGAQLSTNHLIPNLTWRYGYFEWRMRLPNPSRGMFPALWLFNNDITRSSATAGAEIDVMEIFGNATGDPWTAGVHYNNGGLPISGITNEAVVSASDDTANWHRYGVDWQSDHITFYKDGVAVGSVSPAGVTWFQTANLGIRMDYVMDPTFVGSANQSTPSDPVLGTTPQMDVDYVRVYTSFPTGMATGSADPLAAQSPTTSVSPTRVQIAPLVGGQVITATVINELIGNDAEHDSRIVTLESNTRVQTDPTQQIRKMYAATSGTPTVGIDELYNSSGNLKYQLSPDGSGRFDGVALADPISSNGSGVFVGQKDGNRRVILVNGNAGQDVQVDNNNGTFRLLQNGGSRLEIDSNQATFKVGRIISTSIVTTAQTLSLTKEMIFANSASPMTLTLPAATSGAGVTFMIKNIGTGTVTVASAGGTVDTTSIATTVVARYVSDGTNWWSV